MTSPSGWALGDARLDAGPAYVHRNSERQAAERDVVLEAVPAILAKLLSGVTEAVWMCSWCMALHFQPRPEWCGRPCNQVQCQCWCTTGTGQ